MTEQAAGRITADRDRCIGAGLCASSEPGIFGQDDDGLVVLLADRPEPGQGALVQQAIRRCPTQALSLDD
jgi:ferredoxin